jgi:hypothetical protein
MKKSEIGNRKSEIGTKHETNLTQRRRDAEGLEPLGTRNYSDPKNRYSTVGFRLVQRPD